MRQLILCIGFLLITSSAMAHDMALSWSSQSDATGYRVRHSIDNGLTWGVETDVGLVVTTAYPVPDTGLSLIQIGAYNNSGITTWRLDTGLFYNGDWKLPDIPTNVGAQ